MRTLQRRKWEDENEEAEEDADGNEATGRTLRKVCARVRMCKRMRVRASKPYSRQIQLKQNPPISAFSITYLYIYIFMNIYIFIYLFI